MTIASRTLKKVRRRKRIPSQKIAVRANCQDLPIVRHTVYVRKALRPIPGARANGRFAKIPITRVAIAAERAVAVNTAPLSIRAKPGILAASPLRMLGLTARM